MPLKSWPFGVIVTCWILGYVCVKCNQNIQYNENSMYNPNFVTNESVFYSAAANGNLTELQELAYGGWELFHRSSEGETFLHIAAESGNEIAVNTFCQAGLHIEARNQRGETPLMKVIQTENLHITKMLLHLGADPNRKSSKHYNSLHYAVKTGNLNLIKLILKSGVKVNSKDYLGLTPIYIGALNGNQSIINILKNYGANINAEVSKGNTLIHQAIKEENLNALENLIKAGAKLNLVNNNKQFPLELALEKNNLDIIKLIFKKSQLNISNHVLHSLIKQNNILGIKTLIIAGLNVNSKDNLGYTPLFHAAINKNFNIMTFLINSGAKLYINENCYKQKIVTINSLTSKIMNEPDINGKSMVFKEAEKGNIGKMKILIENGGNINNLLNLAIEIDSVKAVESLVKFGVNVNYEDNEGKLPLYKAAEDKKINIVKILLEKIISLPYLIDKISKDFNLKVIYSLIEAGFDLNTKDYNNKTLIYRAAEKNKIDYIKFLMKNGANESNLLHESILEGNEKVISSLISAGFDVNIFDNNGVSPLYLAAEKENIKIVKLLLSKSADSMNTFQLAIKNEQINIINILLSAGINLELKDSEGKSPLYHAACIGNINITKLLLNHGAKGNSVINLASKLGDYKTVNTLLLAGVDVNSVDSDGNTPVSLAIQNGRKDIIDLLVKNGVNTENVLHLIKNSNISLIQPLLETNNLAMNKEKSMLYLAAQEGNINVMQHLINKGEKMDNLLHLAAKKGDITAINSLINMGAKINIKNEEEKTPFYIAAENGKTNVMRILMKHGINIEEENKKTKTRLLHDAIERNNIKAVESIIEVGGNIDARVGNWFTGYTPLHLAVHSNLTHIVKLLLDRGANVNLENRLGDTPLHMAISKGNREIVNILLERGANINKPGIGGILPTKLAQQKGYTDILLLLKSKGGV